MATYSKILLSPSATGASIPIAATAAPGTLLHATTSSTANMDEVWLYAFNNTQSPVNLTIYIGGATASNACITTINPSVGLTLVTPGLVFKGDGSTGSAIYAIGATANAINITGYVNRITG